MADGPRWEGRVEAQLEAIHNEFIPLRALPQAMAVMQLKAEREAEERAQERERREERDKAQDKLISELRGEVATLTRAVDKGNNRRANFALWSPIIVAVITVAGGILLTRPG